MRKIFCLLFAALALAATMPATPAADAARGKYLVGIASCINCHTRGYYFGKPDVSRNLAGSEVGFDVPGLGIFYEPNLTPDKAMGLG
jgi:mono/diheme cytochrome c family protein